MSVSKLATKYQFENFGAVRWNSRGGTKITHIVVHHAATTNFDAMPGVWATREASAHYGIGQNGDIRAYVDEDKRAWHCGNGNSYSIGIECTNESMGPEWKVSDKTVDSLVNLIKEIESRYGKLIIVGHKDVPGNATACPGPSLYPRLQEIRNRVNGATVAKPQPSKPTPKPNNSLPKGFTAEKGTFINGSEPIQVRIGNYGLNAPKGGMLPARERINYDGWINDGTYTWVVYTGFSGDKLFLPVRYKGTAWGDFK